MASFNWQSYNFDFYGMDQMEPPPGHLLLYPVQVGCIWLLLDSRCSIVTSQVETSGEMTNLNGFVSFPDYPSTAKVMGGKSAVIPDKITT